MFHSPAVFTYQAHQRRRYVWSPRFKLFQVLSAFLILPKSYIIQLSFSDTSRMSSYLPSSDLSGVFWISGVSLADTIIPYLTRRQKHLSDICSRFRHLLPLITIFPGAGSTGFSTVYLHIRFHRYLHRICFKQFHTVFI